MGLVERDHDPADALDQKGTGARCGPLLTESDERLEVDAAALAGSRQIWRHWCGEAPGRDALDLLECRRPAERGKQHTGIARRERCCIEAAHQRLDGLRRAAGRAEV